MASHTVVRKQIAEVTLSLWHRQQVCPRYPRLASQMVVTVAVRSGLFIELEVRE